MLQWKLREEDLVALVLIHFHHAHIDLAYSRIWPLVLKRPDLHETQSDLEIVLSSVERLRELSVHVSQNCILDEAWLLKEDELVELQYTVEADNRNDEDR